MGKKKKSFAAFSSVHSLFLSLVANLKKTPCCVQLPFLPLGRVQ